MELIKKNLGLIFFSILTLVFSIWYALYVSSNGGIEYEGSETLLGSFGNMLGQLGFFALALVYGRSVLKLLIGQASFWKRLEPINLEILDLKKYSVKILVVLNKTHSYLGVLAIALIFLHCYLIGSYQDNLLLQLVLVLMAVEGVSGFAIKLKYAPAQLRQKSYLVHRQFTIGVMILILAGLGHLILGD